MHVGSVLVFDGDAPSYEDFAAMIEERLHQVPRYRQKLAFPPLAQARPVWIDDPHFNIGYHVRHTALPAPASDEQLRKLAGRVFSQQLDRSKPLWEIWLVNRVNEDQFALVCKTHHALVDGISGVDIMTVLFDLEADPPPREPGPAWYPRPEPAGATLMGEALTEFAGAPLAAAKAPTGADGAPGPPRGGPRPPAAGGRARAPAAFRPRVGAPRRHGRRAAEPAQHADRPA